MDKVDKTLKKLNKADRLRVLEAIKKLESGSTQGLDIKQLKSSDDMFRVRVGKLRVLFTKNKEGIIVTDITRRSEKTYRDI